MVPTSNERITVAAAKTSELRMAWTGGTKKMDWVRLTKSSR